MRMDEPPRLGSRTDGFEWWHFHVCLEGGGWIFIAVHLTDTFGGPPEPYVSIRVVDRSGETLLLERAPLPLGAFGAGIFHLATKSLMIGAVGASVQVVIRLDSVSADLTFSNIEFSGDLINLYRTPVGRHWWEIVFPVSTVVGFLKSERVDCQVNGIGYHDHNWGDQSANSDALSAHWWYGLVNSHVAVDVEVNSGYGCRHLCWRWNLDGLTLAVASRVLAEPPVVAATNRAVQSPFDDAAAIAKMVEYYSRRGETAELALSLTRHIGVSGDHESPGRLTLDLISLTRRE